MYRTQHTQVHTVEYGVEMVCYDSEDYVSQEEFYTVFWF